MSVFVQPDPWDRPGEPVRVLEQAFAGLVFSVGPDEPVFPCPDGPPERGEQREWSVGQFTARWRWTRGAAWTPVKRSPDWGWRVFYAIAIALGIAWGSWAATQPARRVTLIDLPDRCCFCSISFQSPAGAGDPQVSALPGTLAWGAPGMAPQTADAMRVGTGRLGGMAPLFAGLASVPAGPGRGLAGAGAGGGGPGGGGLTWVGRANGRGGEGGELGDLTLSSGAPTSAPMVSADRASSRLLPRSIQWSGSWEETRQALAGGALPQSGVRAEEFTNRVGHGGEWAELSELDGTIWLRLSVTTETGITFGPGVVWRLVGFEGSAESGSASAEATTGPLVVLYALQVVGESGLLATVDGARLSAFVPHGESSRAHRQAVLAAQFADALSASAGAPSLRTLRRRSRALGTASADEAELAAMIRRAAALEAQAAAN